ASGGRFVLGLGPQIRAHNEKRFSVPWGPPVPRMREYVQALRAIWAAWCGHAPLRFTGAHYRFTLMPPNFVPEPLPCAPPPITLAAVGPAMLRLAGELADGVRLHPFCTRAYLERNVLPHVAAGLAASGRARAHFEINGGGFLATGARDADVAREVAWVRQRIGFYASTPAYWPVLEAEGMADLGPRLNALTKQGAWDRLAAEIPDALLHACTAVGRHDEIADVVAARFGGMSDTLVASASYERPASLPRAVIEAIARIPSTFAGFAPAGSEQQLLGD
ncbi:MAG: TIGR03617 family F420-dependent LLM class oxidoreductase, partial [Gammaproteobacteria bacterium]